MKASAAKHNTGLSAGGAARLWALVLLLLAVFFGSFFLSRREFSENAYSPGFQFVE